MSFTKGNGWAGLAIGLLLVMGISFGACCSLHKRRMEDEDAENEYDEGGDYDDVFNKI